MADKVLFIDDSLLDHELIRMAFRRYGRDSMLEFLSTAEAGLDLIKKEGVKAVFINQILPGMDGFEFLREIKKCRIKDDPKDPRNRRISIILMFQQKSEAQSR